MKDLLKNGALSNASWSDAVRELSGAEATTRRSISSLKSLRAGDRSVGPAYTIRLRRVASVSAQQRDAYLDAFDQAPAGSMVIVEVLGDVGGAVLGDLIGRRLNVIGVAGVVIEGAIRDRVVLSDVAPPLWFARTEMTGIISREVQTQVGVPVQIDGLTVSPGDVVCADPDGVLVMTPADAEAALGAATGVEAREVAVASRLATGTSLRQALDQ